MSTKHIVKNKVGNYLNGKVKRLAMLLGLYKFKQRLKYKCYKNKIGYKEVDEAYTSKTCSLCGYENKKNSNKIFKCEICNYKIDRDVNGARNIMIRGMPTQNKREYKKIQKDHKNIIKKIWIKK